MSFKRTEVSGKALGLRRGIAGVGGETNGSEDVGVMEGKQRK